MAKRKKGQTPYESEHPDRPGMPDVPGHQQHRSEITVNKEQKLVQQKQLEKLGEELGIRVIGSEKKA